MTKHDDVVFARITKETWREAKVDFKATLNLINSA